MPWRRSRCGCSGGRRSRCGSSWPPSATEPSQRSQRPSLAPRPRAFLLLADRERVVDSDADTLRAIAGAADGPDLLVHARWCELLGREALTQRFFHALELAVDRPRGERWRATFPPTTRARSPS